MMLDKLPISLWLALSLLDASIAIGGGLFSKVRAEGSDRATPSNALSKLQNFYLHSHSYDDHMERSKSPEFTMKIKAFLDDTLASRMNVSFTMEPNSTGTFPVANQTGDFPIANQTGDFLVGNLTSDFMVGNQTSTFFFGNNTIDFANRTKGLLSNLTGNWTLANWTDASWTYGNRTFRNWTVGNWSAGNWSAGNWSLNFNNSTGDFNVTGDFINGTVSFVNGTMSGRRLGTFYQNQRNYIRVADEAVDLRLDWRTEESLAGGREKYFINPGMIFVENEDGTTQWVRTIRYHSNAGYSNGVTTYLGEPVQESVWVYFTSILLGSELFSGELRGGFDDDSISRWGIQYGGPLSVADDHMMSNEDTYHMWEDLCEDKPGFLAEKHTLTRKRTTGAEDPKLFVLPLSMNERSKWAVTFSSYPPVHSIEGMSSIDECKWSEYSKFQMYIAPGGEQLANGIASPAHRLSCGNTLSHEKNWIAFDYDNELYYVQNVEPHVVVKVRDVDGTCDKVYETSSTYLDTLSQRVSVRGSATAYRYSEDEYVALLHTHDDYSREPYSTRAYTFEAHPPFRVLRVSKPLPLQSSGLAFASSLTLYDDKVMVGYGVADRASRMMVMSRTYLEEQFESDCDGSVDQLVELSGETCAEKVIGLMLGEDLMPPRRAMNSVGMAFAECRGLLDTLHCQPEMVLRASRHHKANNCNEAFARMSGGVSCSARMKWGVENTEKSDEDVFRAVAEEFKVCSDVISLGCKKEDLHYPESTCQAKLFNNYQKSEPAILLSMTHADQGNLEPMIRCTGISAARGACENKNVEICLKDGQFHLVKAAPVAADSTTAHHTVETIRAAAAVIARRQLTSDAPNIVLHTRNPLEIVFDQVLSAFRENGIVPPDGKIDTYMFKELSQNPENHALIMRTMMDTALRNVQDWQIMKSFIDHPFYNVLMLSDEELSDRLLQPAIIAELSRRFGLTPDHNTILDGLQASETLYLKRQNLNAMKSNDFFLEPSAMRLQYICHLMEMAPVFLQTTIEQGYGREIGILTQYCVGFDEEWIVTAGDKIFVGFSETM